MCVFVCHTCYKCTKALNFKVFRLKDFQRTSKGLPKDLQVAAPMSSKLVLVSLRPSVFGHQFENGKLLYLSCVILDWKNIQNLSGSCNFTVINSVKIECQNSDVSDLNLGLI